MGLSQVIDVVFIRSATLTNVDEVIKAREFATLLVNPWLSMRRYLPSPFGPLHQDTGGG
jgi:hypothetical protein